MKFLTYYSLGSFSSGKTNSSKADNFKEIPQLIILLIIIMMVADLYQKEPV
jgi:hypothetical protein